MAQQETVIITGTTGRIGALLARRLSERYRVVAFDRRPEASAPEAEARFAVDVTDETSIEAALGEVRERFGERIASVIHLVAYYTFSGDPPDPAYEAVNVEGTRRLLQALRGFQVEQFLFTSTMNVHQPSRPGERIQEDSPLDPEQEWQYPRSKVRAEELLRREHGAIPLIIARLASVYDADCRHPVLARQVQRIYERRLTGHLFAGNPECGLTYLHMEDLIEALVRIVDRRAALAPEATLLLGEGEPVSYGALQEALGELIHGEEWTTLRVPQPVAKLGAWAAEHLPGIGDPFIKPWMIDHADDHYALDITRARTLLCWMPSHTLPAILPEMVRSLRRDPERWYAVNDLEEAPTEREAAA
jgi:nucleoside-diphosphate-sugar epimerase